MESNGALEPSEDPSRTTAKHAAHDQGSGLKSGCGAPGDSTGLELDEAAPCAAPGVPNNSQSEVGGEPLVIDATFAPNPPQALTPSASGPGVVRVDGATVGRYRLVRRIGGGGMGEVWEGVDTGITQRQVALKFVRGLDSRELDALTQEAKSTALLGPHPNLVTLFDVVEERGELVLVMEFLQGESLRELLKRHPQGLPWDQFWPLAEGMANGLAMAHNHRVIHRDLKPENVWVSWVLGRVTPKLLDFGLARQGRADSVYTHGCDGSFGYMSPEQFNSEGQTEATDVYSLGVLFFEMATGRLPYGADKPDSMGVQADGHRYSEIPSLNYFRTDPPESLTLLLCEMMAKSAKKRPRDGCTVHGALLEGERVPDNLKVDPRGAPSENAAPPTVFDSGRNRRQAPKNQSITGSGQRGIWWSFLCPRTRKGILFLFLCCLLATTIGFGILRRGSRQQESEAIYEMGVEASDSGESRVAMTHFKRAAGLGSVKAMVRTGQHYDDALGTSRDYSEALVWYRKAANAGNAEAMRRIGWLYKFGQGVAMNPTLALDWYHKADAAGDIKAKLAIGYCFENGEGVVQDFTQAMNWYRKGAEGGDPSALLKIAQMYEEGHGVTQNYAEALKWYEKAAEGGVSYSFFSIGQIYEKGNGVTQNYAEALRWYEKAAETNSSEAMHVIGNFYSSGTGVRQDKTEALFWYRLSWKNCRLEDDESATTALQIAKIYEELKNVDLARIWMKKTTETSGSDSYKSREEAAKWLGSH